MPRFRRDPGDFLLAPLVSFDKTVPGRQTAKPSADAVIGEGRADEVDGSGGLPQVDGKAGLVLAAPRQGHILAGKCLPMLRHGVIPDLLLLLLAPPAGHRHDLPLSPCLLDASGQQLPRPAFQKNIGVVRVHWGQRIWRCITEGMRPVDQDQRPLKGLLPGDRHGSHLATPNSISRVTSSPKEMPMPCIMLG